MCCSLIDRGYISIRAGNMAGYELSVTRALGHKHLSAYGVSCEPTVKVLTLQPEDTCLVSELGGWSELQALQGVLPAAWYTNARSLAEISILQVFGTCTKCLWQGCCSIHYLNLACAVPAVCALFVLLHVQILASDGVWDVMDPREAANRVMDVISAGGTAEEAAQQLVHDTVMLSECSPGGDTDNTTALVLVFE